MIDVLTEPVAQRRCGIEEVFAGPFIELLTLVGYYAALALQLRVFRVTAPDA